MPTFEKQCARGCSCQLVGFSSYTSSLLCSHSGISRRTLSSEVRSILADKFDIGVQRSGFEKGNLLSNAKGACLMLASWIVWALCEDCPLMINDHRLPIRYPWKSRFRSVRSRAGPWEVFPHLGWGEDVTLRFDRPCPEQDLCGRYQISVSAHR